MGCGTLMRRRARCKTLAAYFKQPDRFPHPIRRALRATFSRCAEKGFAPARSTVVLATRPKAGAASHIYLI